MTKHSRRSASGRIEHYLDNTEALELQKETNFNSATANLLATKQMLLQWKHKLYDLEFAMGQLEAAGASQVRLDRQMMAVRESVGNIDILTKEVQFMEVEIGKKYSFGV